MTSRMQPVRQPANHVQRDTTVHRDPPRVYRVHRVSGAQPARALATRIHAL